MGIGIKIAPHPYYIQRKLFGFYEFDLLAFLLFLYIFKNMFLLSYFIMLKVLEGTTQLWFKWVYSLCLEEHLEIICWIRESRISNTWCAYYLGLSFSHLTQNGFLKLPVKNLVISSLNFPLILNEKFLIWWNLVLNYFNICKYFIKKRNKH